MSIKKIFDVDEKVIIITGSAGLLGSQYTKILSDAGAILVLVDINSKKNNKLLKNDNIKFHKKSICLNVDITSKVQVTKLAKDIFIEKY